MTSFTNKYKYDIRFNLYTIKRLNETIQYLLCSKSKIKTLYKIKSIKSNIKQKKC